MDLDEFLANLGEVRRNGPPGFWEVHHREGSNPLYWTSRDGSRSCTPITVIYNALHGTIYGMLPPKEELPLAIELGLSREVAIQIMDAAQGVRSRPVFLDYRDHHGYDERLRQRLMQELRPMGL